jgi:hypothetical protein
MEDRNNETTFAILPANVRHTSSLKPNEKLLYCEIRALSQLTGECWATNTYFAQLYQVSKRSIQRWLTGLIKHGYIKIKFRKRKKKKERIIQLLKTKKEK